MKVPRQPEVNIGMIGHVDHGKTTLTRALTGEWTDRHSEELRRGISIRLGYADAAFYKCPKCEEPKCYSTDKECSICGEKTEFLRAVSFVDAPGHETLMATMLSGAALMDGALLLIAANEECPQPQTKEHLMGLAISGVENVIIVQNKIDIVEPEAAKENYEQIKDFLEGTEAENSPIIPVSANHSANLDVLIMEIENRIKTSELDDTKPPKAFVARSFDVNSPGISPEKIVGGVIGGSLLQGKLKVGDEIEVSPGREVETSGQKEWMNMQTEVTSLFSGGSNRKESRPGGLIAIGTKLDPVLTKSDSLTGRVIGTPGTLPPVRSQLTMDVNLLERVVGTIEDMEVDEIRTSEPLMLSVGTATTVGVVSSARPDSAETNLKIPVSAEKGQRIAISRRIGGKWRLIGYGVIK
jgi:translation initiation factor 2 subunit 3